MKKLNFAYGGENKVYTLSDKATKNTKYNYNQLISRIKRTPPIEIEQIRERVKLGVLTGENWKDIKKAVKPLKNNLDWFLCSGFCDTHHNDKALTDYNGCVQIDIDFKFTGGDEKAHQLKEQIQSINYIAFAAISPSGYGVKALALTDNTQKENHNAVIKQVINDLSVRLNIDTKDIDNLNLSQPCFIPYDNNVYFRFSPTKFKLDTKKISESKKLASCDTFLKNVGTSFNIEALGLCDKFAASKGFKLNNGTNHLYFTFFSICANLLGISKTEVVTHASKLGINVNSNCFSPFEDYKESFGRWGDLIAYNNSRKIIKGIKGDKLTDILPVIEDYNFRLLAPTGTGKTYWSLNQLGKKIIAVPTVGLVENICNDGYYKQFSPLPIHENARNLIQVLNSNCIVTTYASLPSVVAKLNSYIKDYRLFIDEYHNFSSSTASSFRLNDLERVLRIAPSCKSVTMLSGTELFNAHKFISELPIIDVQIPKPKKEFILVDAENGIKFLVDGIKECIKIGGFPVVLLNDKGVKLETIKNQLQSFNIAYFNADNKDDKDFKEVVENGKISNDVQGIISTTVINEGNNIYNNYDYQVFVLGVFHASEIEQFSNRFRTPRSITGCLIRSIKKEKKTVYFRTTRHAKFLENSCTTWCNELNIKSEVSEDLIFYEFLGRSHIQGLPVTRNQHNEYGIDYLLLNNFVFEREKIAMYQDDNRMIEALEKYNIIVTGSMEYKLFVTPNEDSTNKISRSKYKEQLKEDYSATLDKIKEQFYSYNFCSTQSKIKSISKGAKLAYNNFIEVNDKLVDCFGVKPNEQLIFKQLKEVGTSKAKFRLLKKRINLFCLYSNKDYMKSNRKFTLLIKKVFSKFKNGHFVTGDVIKKRVVECLKVDKTFDLSVFEQERNTKAIQVLRLFFSAKSELRSVDGVKVKGYVCGNLILGGITRKTSQNKVTAKLEKQIIKDLETLIN